MRPETGAVVSSFNESVASVSSLAPPDDDDENRSDLVTVFASYDRSPNAAELVSNTVVLPGMIHDTQRQSAFRTQAPYAPSALARLSRR